MVKSKSLWGFAWVIIITFVVVTAWVFFEWLFFVTKPSFMNLYSSWEKVGVLSGTALIMSILLLIGSLPFFAFGWLLKRFTRFQMQVPVLILFPATILMTFTMLLLIDNFMLTLMGWGIRNAQATGVWAFRLLSIILFVYASQILQRFLIAPKAGNRSNALVVAVGLILLAGIPVLLGAVLATPEKIDDTVHQGGDRPNILILSGDGIWAKHMSVYGYERATTPFMDSVQNEFLLAENHFTNASDTGGSVVSLLSGKYATTTRVIYPPDVLRGRDSYQHLPGLLKKLGYYNVDISIRHYADPFDLNMRGGFAEANFRILTDTSILPISLIRSKPGLNSISLFMNKISERLLQRLGHIWRNQSMLDPMAEVNKPDKRYIQDDAKMAEIHRLIDSGRQPFFLHVHMMGTHGTRFGPRERIYSSESNYKTDWDEDGYDDAITDFDRYVGETYNLLKETGKLDSTIFVISSDHGFKHDPLHRLPMMVRFPGQARKGKIGGNTQRLDIAPTLLDAIGIEPPAWMEGQSFLEADSSQLATRPIFASASHAAKSVNEIPGGGLSFWTVINLKPPWFSMGKLYLVSCDQGFSLHLESMKMLEIPIEGSTVKCQEKLSMEDARLQMMAHLRNRKYP